MSKLTDQKQVEIVEQLIDEKIIDLREELLTWEDCLTPELAMSFIRAAFAHGFLLGRTDEGEALREAVVAVGVEVTYRNRSGS